MRKKRLKRELRALADRQDELDQAQRRLATHLEVIAVAVRSPDLVAQSDVDDAIAGVHALNAVLGGSSFPGAARGPSSDTSHRFANRNEKGTHADGSRTLPPPEP